MEVHGGTQGTLEEMSGLLCLLERSAYHKIASPSLGTRQQTPFHTPHAVPSPGADSPFTTSALKAKSSSAPGSCYPAFTSSLSPSAPTATASGQPILSGSLKSALAGLLLYSSFAPSHLPRCCHPCRAHLTPYRKPRLLGKTQWPSATPLTLSLQPRRLPF